MQKVRQNKNDLRGVLLMIQQHENARATPDHTEVLKMARDALEFYSRKEHWMQISPESTNSRVFIAMRGNGNQDGFEYALEALAAINAAQSEQKEE